MPRGILFAGGLESSVYNMKAGIHPAYNEVKVICACGSSFTTRSTGGDRDNELHVEICSACHPFFTGRQKLMDTEGRVDRFQRKMAKSKAMQEQIKSRKN
jgi:large subunit ribosomal protein L31